MSDRRTRIRSKNRTLAYIAAGLVHGAIIASMVFNFTSDPKPIVGAYAEKVDVVKATTVDESQINKRKQDIERLEREKEREKKKEAEKKKRDKEKAERLEAERKAISLKKKQEQAKLEKEKLEKKKKEQLRKKKEEAERLKREQSELEAKRQLEESIAAEEAFLADQIAQERTATIISKYSYLITQKVDSVRTISPDFERWRVTTINIKLSPRGDVVSTRIVRSSGSERYDRSVEAAILQSSPLPIPTPEEDANANRIFRDIDYEFPMPGA